MSPNTANEMAQCGAVTGGGKITPTWEPRTRIQQCNSFMNSLGELFQKFSKIKNCSRVKFYMPMHFPWSFARKVCPSLSQGTWVRSRNGLQWSNRFFPCLSILANDSIIDVLMLKTCWENNGNRVKFSWRKIFFFLVAWAKHNISGYVFHKVENVRDLRRS